MTRTLFLVGTLLVSTPAFAQSTETSTRGETSMRADALLGLARVARDTGRFVEADARFNESERLRPFDVEQRKEHFWVIAKVDAERAMRVARELATAKAADAAIFDQWLALAAQSQDDEQAGEAGRHAHAALPGAARWPRRLGESLLRRNRAAEAAEAFAFAAAAPDGTTEDVAMRAISLERAGNLAAAATVWAVVPASARRQHADWWASDLRARLSVEGSASLVSALAEFVGLHPSDDGMRAMAVEALAGAGQVRQALALIRPLVTGANANAWRRREGELAAAAGDASRARNAFRHVEASGHATPEDRWRYLELAAPLVGFDEALSRLAALRSTDTPCADRSLGVADTADADQAFAWVADARAASCAMPERVALRAARWLVGQQKPDMAEALLTRAADGTSSDAIALALAERQVARGDAARAEATLAARIDAQGSEASFALVAAHAWALARLDRPADGWRLVGPSLASRSLAADELADWSGLALAADERDAAADLARRALGSSRDASARQVLASLAQRQGQQRVAYEWLAPVADGIASAVAACSWLDAVAGVHGAAAALDAAGRLPAVATDDIDVAIRLARWAASAGRLDEAVRHTASVRGRDPRRADLLTLEMDVAAGHAASVVERLADAPLDSMSVDTMRLFVTAALNARAWQTAHRALDAWQTRRLDGDWWLLKTAERLLGEEGRLPSAFLETLEQRAADAPSDELTVRIAQGHAAQMRVDEALDRLGWPSMDASTPVVVREAAVGVLLGAHRPSDALALMPAGTSSSTRLQAFRVRALLTLQRAGEARDALEAMPSETRRADDWATLAELSTDATERARVLEQALNRWPRSAALWAAMASTRQHLGQSAAAREAALTSLSFDEHQLEAWRVRLATPPAGDSARATELVEAGERFATMPDVRVELAEAAMANVAGDATRAAILQGWLAEALPTAAPGRVLLLRARLATATGDWDRAIEAIASARELEPRDLALQHLDAQVHAWSGRHEPAARRFAVYLADAPDDGDAWREYGRLLSWMQQLAPSQEAYTRAARIALMPAVEAERRTKAALSRQAWRLAATEAASWLALEPASLDARMDRALALDRSGAVDEAAPLFADLANAPTLPQDLRLAAARYGLRHRPSADVQVLVESSAGYGDQRLLEQRLVQVGVSDRLGVGGRTAVFADVGRGTLDAGDMAWTLMQLRTGAGTQVGRHWQVSAQAAWSMLGDTSPRHPAPSSFATSPTGAPASLTVNGALVGALADGLRLSVAAERRPFWENGATVESGLYASGSSAALQWTPSSRWLVQGAGAVHGLSDGNRRHETSASVALRGSRGDRDFELRSSTMLFGYQSVRAMYFSPDQFLRTDLEGEVRHWFGRPRSDGERRAYLAAGLGVGVDSRDARYGLGLARVTVPLGGTWSVVGEGRWVQASVYRSSRISMWLQAFGAR